MPERPSQPLPSRAPDRVWLVEDNPLDAQRTLALLGRFYAVTHFDDAASMLERLSDQPPPDLLLLDWQLPGVSGLEACRFVREHHDEAALPVLMLTVRGAREDFREGLTAGANDYVAKPYDETELLARVRTLLRMRRAISDARSAQVLAEATQAELELDEERLRRVVEATGVGTWEFELATHHILADARMRELFWFAPGVPLTQEEVFEAVHPEDRERVFEAVTRALAGASEGRYAMEYRIQNTEGQQRWVEARGRAYFRAADKPVSFLGTVLDITPRKEAESAQAEFLQALTSQPLLAVAIIRGPQHVIEKANAPYQQMVGNRDVVGKPLLEALPELKGQGFDTLLTRVMQTGEPFVGRETSVVLGRRGEGRLEEAFFNFVYQPMRGREGLFDGVLVVAQDVTDMVRARQDAERRARETKGRSDFEQQLIGIVSHDLRNPLQAIHLGVASLLRPDDLSERQTKIAVRIQSSVERASRMIRDLLDFTQARLGSGISIKRGPTDVFDVVRNVLQEVEAIYPGREVRLQQEGDGKGEWDADRLAQAVQNLVTNALKYSPENTPVTVTMRGGPGQIVLQVQNAGAPIRPELLPRIFEPLQRATAEVDRQGRSVGLGLYIVKHLVEAHGGTVEVKSSEEEGTTFQVRLPRSAPGAAS